MDTQTTGTAPRPQESKPKISVIIPFFGDPRGKPRHILSWTHRQTCAAHDFEVIVLCHCIKAQWEQEIASYLRPHDRLIRARVTNGIDLYDVGARAARGEILFITEDHCVAEHSCIAEALRFFEANTDAAASMQSGHIDYTELARLEHLAYERYVVPWGLAPDHWEKVSIRGIAIRRSLYFAAGGMPGRFGPFAEALLSARLHAGGHKVGSIPAVGLRHVNMRSWPHVHVNVSSVTRGECLFRDEGDPDFCERYFGIGPEWSERFFCSRKQSLAAAWAIARTMWFHPWRSWDIRELGRLTRACCDRLAVALTGPRLRLFPRLLAVVAGHFRCAWRQGDEKRRVEAFMGVWQALQRYFRVRYLVEHAADEGPGDWPLSCRYEMAEVSPRQLAGFHTQETANGKTFRWTGPLAMLRVHVPPGNHEVTLDTGGLRGPDCSFPLGLFWNGHRIPRESVHAANGRLAFSIDRSLFVPGPEQRLTIVCGPLRPSHHGIADDRLLGVPVCSVAFQAAAETARAPGEKLAA